MPEGAAKQRLFCLRGGPGCSTKGKKKNFERRKNCKRPESTARLGKGGHQLDRTSQRKNV